MHYVLYWRSITKHECITSYICYQLHFMLDINNNTYMHYVLYWLSIGKHACITSYIGHQQSRYGRIHFGSSVVVSGMSSGKHVVLQDLQRFVASAARRRSQQSMWHSLSMRYVARMVCAILGYSDQVSLPAISERVRTMLEPADRARRRVPYILMPQLHDAHLFDPRAVRNHRYGLRTSPRARASTASRCAS